MNRNLDLGVMTELLFTEIIMMSFFMLWLWPVKKASEIIFITHDTMKVTTGFYLALTSSICLVVISLLRFMEKPLEYKESICYSSAFIVLLSAGLWCVLYQY